MTEKDKHCPKPCPNSEDKHHCEHCGVGCTDDQCDKQNCEIITDLIGHKKLTCMCPTTSCICLGREPTKEDFGNLLVDIYSR